MGILSDRFSPWLLASATLALTSLSTFVLWGVLSYSLAGVLAYGIAYGCLAGGWSSLWTGFVRPIAKDDPSLSTSIFGIFMLSRGVGNILSTPVSTALQRVQFSQSTVSLTGQALNGYKVAGGQYERMIIYVGTCFAGAAVIVATGWIAEGRHRR
ncbi:hypothetical protein PHLCEN_2v12377 [Hermanssonia centrifuga]|uniref:Uncharacterized protein n=1 Tax=Hermanssonia centrifuga TaxID=98765 RepID=A0A2R6NHA2_9APHY|nr:hypothetical protein PHLCEN_2v12377 [Hermanssonia centrifuga]